jgi:RNA-directed DNA polymerase
MGAELREMQIHHCTRSDLDDLAQRLNPIARGWMQCCGRFYSSEMYPLLQSVNTYLRRWARKKYMRLHSYARSKRWWDGVIERQPNLFSQWAWVRVF